ncbi:MAG TPA: PfkB family carbohydrate kinase [Hypericibacter adhaerens]|uniref:Fructosamine kinase FrlD n=1 Tax=Hypericibacter adhaerens TaxID=2602016 RepID=A0A5J6MW36_9PROT|nr:PfkB family carbohydrate kinase [Hypericibacter adhaerens]QEX20400.1 fructosamine kinase FrlD [Hypericibacter adhaerens]HWA46546.1 PfkB family carbohydrate kinase [Hypericibacter adhaerens]
MRVTAIGDCGIDRYVDLRADRPGGISLNFAANAKRWFDKADSIAVLTALGEDREAGIVEATIAGLGIGAFIAKRPGITPVQYIDRDARGERIFVRYEAGALAAHRLGGPEREVLRHSDVMIATVFTQILDFFETVAEAPSGGLRALDYCNLGTADEPLRYVQRYATRFDLGFFGLSPAQAPLIDALETIARERNRLFIVTLGPEGSLALGGRERIRAPAVAVPKVVDTTGAGDSFAAGFLSLYARSRDVAASLARGAEAAARTIGEVGAFPAPLVPWPADAPAEWAALKRS